MMPDTLDSNSSQKYQIRFFYDWHCDSPFWAANEIAYAKFDVGPIDPEALGLSVELSKRLQDMSD